MEQLDHPGLVGIITDHFQGTVREMMHISRTEKAHPEDSDAVQAGIQKIIDEVARTIHMVNFGSAAFGSGKTYHCADWYQNTALTRKRNDYGDCQVSAKRMTELMKNEPYQGSQPHFDVMVIDKDMTLSGPGDGINYIYGYGPYPFNIVSTYRFHKFYRERFLRQACFALLGAHEFGHNLGLVYRPNNVGSGEFTAGHCNGEQGPCIMEQTHVPGCKTMGELVRQLLYRESWLCPDCLEYMNIVRNNVIQAGIVW